MKTWMSFLVLFTSSFAFAEPKRLVSLAPHTTELVFALGVGDKLLAVSDYSDYPTEASALPSVASHHGVNFEKIINLQPDLIIAWKGGNKPQDLNRLASLGFKLFYSNPSSPKAIAEEILVLGQLLGKRAKAKSLSDDFRSRLNKLRQRYMQQTKKQVFYYMWPKPLMSIGGGAWANHLLEICGARNIFADLSVDYPQVNLEDVIKRQPGFLVASMNTTVEDAKAFWENYSSSLRAKVIVVNPDRLHRFTPRLMDGLENMCEQLN